MSKASWHIHRRWIGCSRLARPSLGLRKEMPNYVTHTGPDTGACPRTGRLLPHVGDDANLPDGPAGSAPIHAWRALGQLRAVEVAEPLLNMQNRLDDEDDNWCLNQFPDVFGMVGPAAIPALAAYLADNLNGEFPHISAADGLYQIAKQHPERRSNVVKASAIRSPVAKWACTT